MPVGWAMASELGSCGTIARADPLAALTNAPMMCAVPQPACAPCRGQRRCAGLLTASMLSVLRMAISHFSIESM